MMDRRTVLSTGAVLAGLGLSGCLDVRDDGADGTPADSTATSGPPNSTRTPTPTKTTETATPTETETRTETPTDGIPEWADHRISVDASDYDEAASYHLVVGDRIEATEESEETFNDGTFGHADRTELTLEAEYYAAGRLLSVKLKPSLVELGVQDHREAPITVRIDGDPIDFERWDPSRGDLPMGYGGAGALPDDLVLYEEDCDYVVSSLEELKDVRTDLGPGSCIGFDADVNLPEEAGTPLMISLRHDDLTLVGLEKDDGTLPTLYRDEPAGYRGNKALTLRGDRVAVINLQIRGPLDHYEPDLGGISWIRGLSLTGDDPFVLNCHGWYWSYTAFGAGGTGETFLCVDAHHNMLDGLGYGISTYGPLSNKNWSDGETWSESELESYVEWHRRTEINRAVFDANRHDVAAGDNASYEVRRFVTGPTDITGHRLDMHRPGGGVLSIGEGIIEESTRGVTDDGEAGVRIRGWPVIGARIEDVWFTWGEEPDPEHRHPGINAPIVQVCATEDTRDRRGVWDRTNGPFKNVEWYDCAFGPEEPEGIPAELRRARSQLPGRWGIPAPEG